MNVTISEKLRELAENCEKFRTGRCATADDMRALAVEVEAREAGIADARRELMAFTNEVREEQPPDTRAIEWLDEIVCNLDVAARIEQLGRSFQQLATDNQAHEECAKQARIEEAERGRVEEKKAAVIEAAKVYSDIAGRFIRGEYKGADTLPRQVDYAREHLRLAVAALVESEKEKDT